jgi:hypothetical protein
VKASGFHNHRASQSVYTRKHWLLLLHPRSASAACRMLTFYLYIFQNPFRYMCQGMPLSLG